MDYSPLRCVFVTFKVSFERTLRKAETHKGEYSIIYLKAGGAQEKFVDKDWIRKKRKSFFREFSRLEREDNGTG